jgi:DNA repair protein RecO (recombination protein O)
MENLKLKAVVLSSIDYREKDKIIKLFSLENGMISAVLKGVRSDKAKLKFASQPFCFANFLLVKRGAYYVVTSAELEDSFFDLTKDINTYYTAFALLEVVQASLMEEQSSPIVFINLLKALRAMCYDKINPKLVLLKFVLGMLKVLGYRFNFKTCDNCKAEFINKKHLNLNTGAIVCGSCNTINCKQLSVGMFNTIKVLYNTEIDRLDTINTTESTLNETLGIIIKNFEARTEKKLKTIKQL